MAHKKRKINLNYNLKDKSEEQTLVYLIGCLDKRFKVSTQQSVWVKTWNNKTQRCIVSTEYSDRINRASRKVNKFLDSLDAAIDEHFEKYPPRFDLPNWVFNKADNFKTIIQRIIDEQVSGERREEEKKKITPLQFFQSYVDNMPKRVDPRTRKFISDRTVGHHKTVESKGLNSVSIDSVRTFSSKVDGYVRVYPLAKEHEKYPLILDNIKEASLRITISVDTVWGGDTIIHF